MTKWQAADPAFGALLRRAPPHAAVQALFSLSCSHGPVADPVVALEEHLQGVEGYHPSADNEQVSKPSQLR